MNIGRFCLTSAAVFLLLTGRAAPTAASALDALSADGVYTWRVPATDEAPAWCCFRWMHDSPVGGTCDLDSKQCGYGTQGNDLTLDGEVQIYVSIESGKAGLIRALSPECRVTSRREIRDLGEIS